MRTISFSLSNSRTVTAIFHHQWPQNNHHITPTISFRVVTCPSSPPTAVQSMGLEIVMGSTSAFFELFLPAMSLPHEVSDRV